VFDSVSVQSIKTALSGLSARQRVIADNIANIQTPGFLAGRVQFEDALKQAVESGQRPGAVTPSVSRSLEPTRTDGNNVNLDTETLSGIDTNLRYQLMTQAVSGRFSSLSNAMRFN
jgi:flagellar basal-body rod protein FlgB